MIELITTSFFVFSSIYGGPVATGTSMIASSAPTVTTSQIEGTTTDQNVLTASQIAIQAKAQTYFKDEPILADIAGCESSFRQYDADGDVLTGKIDKDDIGVMQINTHYQGQKAQDLGYDLNTTEGNMAYAKYLYQKEGTKPWESSEKCWGNDTTDGASDQVAMK